MRKEQGRKLKEMMEKKRQDKNKKLQEELKDLENIQFGKQEGSLDIHAFKEELQHRGFGSTESFMNKINQLKLKLKIKQDDDTVAADTKYNLIDREDHELTPDEIKQKRIQKM